MSNLLNKIIIRSAVLALVFSSVLITTANAAVTRLRGVTRYSTSDAIVKAGWQGRAETAVLASGLDANRIDALTIAPLAKAKNAPVVLVNPSDPVASIVSKFNALNAKTVYIANGTGIISTSIEAGLKATGITVNRLGGANRYITALNIAKELGVATSIVIASGDNAHLADELSIASIAAAKGMPIFLATNATKLDAATTAYISSLGAKTTYVLGGTTVVSDEAISKQPGVIRLAGAKRYETNAKIVDTFKTDPALDLANIFIASGEDANLIDALAGAPLAALKGAPIIFVHDTINPAVNTLLKSVVNVNTNIIELGGISAVSPAANYAINTLQTGINSDTAVIFPDKNLEQVIRETIKKPSGDIFKSDVEKITVLRARELKITNLSGIENLINLTSLDLYYNQISNIDSLKELTNLTTLNLGYNKINNIEALIGLTNLNTLNLSSNQISNTMPLNHFTNLITLYLSGNQISSIDSLRGLLNLSTLDLSINQISNLEPLIGLTKMYDLRLTYNQITNIEALKGLTRLNILWLPYNKISNLEPLRGLTKLTILSLFNNQIRDVAPLKGLTNLTVLFLYNNLIVSPEPRIRIELAGLTKIRQLYLSESESWVD